MQLYALSVVLMYLITVICAVAALYPGYRDNLLQRIGLAAIGIGCALRGQEIAATHFVSTLTVMLQFGALSYAIGTASKVVHFGRRHANRSNNAT